jgi:hypothetical protein
MHYETNEELCLHRYYGGDELTNVGGVCILRPEGRAPEMEFPYLSKSPAFTNDVYLSVGAEHLTVERQLFPAEVERYCRDRCSCLDKKTYEKVRAKNSVFAPVKRFRFPFTKDTASEKLANRPQGIPYWYEVGKLLCPWLLKLESQC